jgi:hypothetical protein
LHHGEPDFTLELANFAVVLLPFAFSILFAFVPDMRTKHIAWRIAVVMVGVGFSWLVWQQQHLTMEASKRDLGTAVDTAVGDANKHTDQKIQDVQKQVNDVATGLDSKLTAVDSEVSKGDSEITGAIGKVIIPEPRYAEIKFSLLPATDITIPILDQSLPVDATGTISVDFMASNISDTTATSLELWVEICKGCTYVKEPDKLENAGGLSTIRHRAFGNLNPGVSIEKMTVQIAAPTDAPFAPFNIGFMYSCQTCGKRGPEQVVTIRPQYPAAAQ